jgi:hypothetical protein
VAFLRRRLKVQNLLVSASRHRQRFAWQHFDRRCSAAIHRSRRHRRISMTVVVVLQVLEYVAYVEKRIPVQANVHECRLHPRQDSRYFSFVDTADKRELFLALNVDFD